MYRGCCEDYRKQCLTHTTTAMVTCRFIPSIRRHWRWGRGHQDIEPGFRRYAWLCLECCLSEPEMLIVRTPSSVSDS